MDTQEPLVVAWCDMCGYKHFEGEIIFDEDEGEDMHCHAAYCGVCGKLHNEEYMWCATCGVCHG